MEKDGMDVEMNILTIYKYSKGNMSMEKDGKEKGKNMI